MRTCAHCNNQLFTGGMRHVKTGNGIQIFCPAPKAIIGTDCANLYLKNEQQKAHYASNESYQTERYQVHLIDQMNERR